jgi:hypothetical protein
MALDRKYIGKKRDLARMYIGPPSGGFTFTGTIGGKIGKSH